jgi:hypothetical protein
MKSWFFASILAVILAGPASATTITATCSGGHPSAPIVHSVGPVESGAILAEVLIPYPVDMQMSARAALDIDGNSALESAALYATSEPGPLPQLIDGETVWTHTVTNNGSAPVSYHYSFLLHPVSLSIIAPTAEDDPASPLASYDVEVRANGVIVFEAHAVLKGGGISHSLTESGTDLGGVVQFSDGITYNFSEYQGQVGVGSALPGQSITVETKLASHTQVGAGNTGAFVSMGDPLDLKDDPGVSSTLVEEDNAVAVEAVSWGGAKHVYR